MCILCLYSFYSTTNLKVGCVFSMTNMNMSNFNAYKEWKDLFNENVDTVWREEPIPLLKKLSMLLVSIKKHIKEIEDEVDRDVSNLRRKVIETPKIQDRMESQFMGISNNNKVNIEVKNTENSFTLSKNISENVTVDSPEMFQNVEASLIGPNDSSSIIISDDTASTVTNESPEIKRKKRHHSSQKRSQRLQRLRDNTSKMSLLGELNACEDGGNDRQENDKEIRPTSVMDDNSSMDFFRGLIGRSQVAESSIKEKDHNDVKGKKQDIVLTPTRNDCDVDMSVVQCTPVNISLPKRYDKTSSYLLKRKGKGEKRTTLTQMFSRKRSVQYEEQKVRLPESDYDSDATCFDPASTSKTTKTDSLMGITGMVNFLNPDSTLEDDKTITEKVRGITNLDPNPQQIADFVDDIRYEDFEDDTSLNSAIVEENEGEEADVPQRLNDFFAKAQNVPQHQLEAAPVVRGKARQNLPGWACKDCEKFYLNQGLNTAEMLALNKCSKHRGQYRPREDTLPGFWDMNLRSQETENTK